MSKQLAVASAFSVLALSALALFGPSLVHAPGNSHEPAGATMIVAADFLAPLASLD